MTFASDVAREIDRLVVGGHGAAARSDRPPVLGTLTAQPGLLIGLGIVLVHRPVTREEIGLTMPYTPPAIIDALVEDNVGAGVVEASPDGYVLTAAGRPWADGVIALQELAIEALWKDAGEAVDAVLPIVQDVVVAACDLDPPMTPTAFPLFAGVGARPSRPAQVLGLVTALRYWRADAHRRALDDADLSPRAAHALNCLWDAHRQATRLGQGPLGPSAKGLADLAARGLVADEVITPAGLELRLEVEAATDRHTDPIYGPLDDGRRTALLRGLSALPPG